ncbi:expansin-A8-like [Panicum miliaceum]|uniref:Expansin-A8-like n=1 Tax=Panicum miliaceum TaxID=4540 RepID=A0A3L6SL07_PANMI|nr:expansin-A8-like [Panicum miliaceum]
MAGPMWRTPEVGLAIGTLGVSVLLLAILIPMYLAARARGPSVTARVERLRDQITKLVGAVMALGIILASITHYHCLFRIGGMLIDEDEDKDERMQCFELVTVANVGGSSVVGARTDWMAMTWNWGANWQSNAYGQSLSFRLRSDDCRVITANNVAPLGLWFGDTYTSNAQFY